MNKEKKNSLEGLLGKVANAMGFEIHSLILQTNKQPIVIEIIIKKIKKFVFYGCKQKNNNNIFLELDLLHKNKTIK